MLASSASSLFALMATFAMLSTSDALPTRSSSSRVSRRGRIYRRATLDSAAKKTHSIVIDASAGGGISSSTINVNFNGKDKERRALDKNTGDHSIIVDASSSAANAESAGIKNSTINLTVISNANKRGLPRMIADLFKRTPTAEPVSKIKQVERRAISFRGRARVAKRQGGFVTDLAAQESAYAAGIAALNDATITASAPIVTASPVSFNVLNNSSAPDNTTTTLNSTTPLNTTATMTNSTLMANATSLLPNITATIVPTATSLPPITLTVTLVPSGVSNAYIDAAGLPTSSGVSSAAVPTETAEPESALDSSWYPVPSGSMSYVPPVNNAVSASSSALALSSSIVADPAPSTSTVVVLSTSTVQPVTRTVSIQSSVDATTQTSVPKLERRVRKTGRTAEVWREGKPVLVYLD